MTPAILLFLLSIPAAARDTGHADLLMKHAKAHAAVVSVAGRIEVRMTHSVTGRAGPVPPPERYAFRVRATRDDSPAAERNEETWMVEITGTSPRTEPLRYGKRAVWTRSGNGQWARDPGFRDAGALKMLAVARGWAFQYLEDVPERWAERARVRVLDGAYRYGGKRAWLIEVVPKWRLVQTSLAARWEVTMSPDGLPLHSRSTDHAGREVTVIDSRDWRMLDGLPVSHSFTIVVRPPQERRPDAPDPVTTLSCRLSDVVVRMKPPEKR